MYTRVAREKIQTWESKFEPTSSDSSLEAQIEGWRLRLTLGVSNGSLGAQIEASRLSMASGGYVPSLIFPACLGLWFLLIVFLFRSVVENRWFRKAQIGAWMFRLKLGGSNGGFEARIGA